MTSKIIYHYVYRITNIVERKHYYGKRSSRIDPSHDLGVKYFSSSKNKQFIFDQKENPSNYRYKIVAKFNTSSEAIHREILLHSKFDVSSNPAFYNKAKQTTVGFDVTGMKIPKTTEQIRKHSLARTGKSLSEDHKTSISKSRKGQPNPNKGKSGKPHTEESKKKIADSRRGKKRPPMSEEQKQKISATKKLRFKQTSDHGKS